jgi:hypothetical protein
MNTLAKYKYVTNPPNADDTDVTDEQTTEEYVFHPSWTRIIHSPLSANFCKEDSETIIGFAM